MPRREEYSFMAASLMRQPFSEIILSFCCLLCSSCSKPSLSAGIGTALLLITYFVVEHCNFGIYLPVSATMAIIALPLMAFLFMKEKQ